MTTEARLISLQPVGCTQCGAASLAPVGGGKFQCRYCGAFMLERDPPPFEPAAPHADETRPPASRLETISAFEVLHLDPEGELPPPTTDELALALDKGGPRQIYRPRPLSRFLRVEEVRAYAPLRVQYTVFSERREYEQITRPHRGEPVDGSPLPPLWRTPLSPKTEETRVLVDVRGQEQVGTCPGCGGGGQVGCETCSGTGRNRCNFCGGDGKRERHRHVNGKRVVDRERCSACRGQGGTRCGACQGSGRRTCGTCEGRREVVHGHRRVHDYALRTATHSVSAGRDWSQHRFLDHAEGELLYDHAVTGLLDFTDTRGQIAQLADQVMAEHNQAVSDGFAYWSRLTVTRVPVVEVRYRIRSKGGVLHVYGKDRRVAMPGPKPVGCAGCLLFASGALACAVAALAAMV